MEGDKHIFILLKNPDWDEIKDKKFHLFGMGYLKDGSKELIEETAQYALDIFIKGEKVVYEDEYPSTYWKYIPKSYFMDYWVNQDLLNDKAEFERHKDWLESTINEWAYVNKLPIKIERDKPRQFVLKFIIFIPVTVDTTTTVSETLPT